MVLFGKIHKLFVFLAIFPTTVSIPQANSYPPISPFAQNFTRSPCSSHAHKRKTFARNHGWLLWENLRLKSIHRIKLETKTHTHAYIHINIYTYCLNHSQKHRHIFACRKLIALAKKNLKLASFLVVVVVVVIIVVVVIAAAVGLCCHHYATKQAIFKSSSCFPYLKIGLSKF